MVEALTGRSTVQLKSGKSSRGEGGMGEVFSGQTDHRPRVDHAHQPTCRVHLDTN